MPPEILGRGGLEYAADRAGLLDQSHKLVMEITERGLPDKLGARALEMAGQAGIRIALDDVVFGGRNLVVLSRCNIHILKVDRSLTAQIGSPDHTQPPPWLDHLAALQLGAELAVIIEGVETREQVDTLVAAGVKLVQGFDFSRPLKAADFIAYHARHLPGADESLGRWHDCRRPQGDVGEDRRGDILHSKFWICSRICSIRTFMSTPARVTARSRTSRSGCWPRG